MANEEVIKEARIILEKFGKDLEGVKISSKVTGSKGYLREEKKGQECDVDFKTIMFKNAPDKDEECIILEKAHWN